MRGEGTGIRRSEDCCWNSAGSWYVVEGVMGGTGMLSGRIDGEMGFSSLEERESR